ncbi:MAG: translational GTPase TypA [Acidimicrobiales bacterium]
MPSRQDLRNVAIVAHVDHGKTTLVDAIFRQAGVFRDNQQVAERVMDSMDLEREKGITILAKQTAVHHRGVKINIVDTPGHSDFGGEVERGLAMVDGVVLLVDAAEGPLPQTRFVLRKALEARLPIVVVLNKVDRADSRPAEVLDDVYELFMDLGADESQIDFPVVYSNAKAGWAVLEQPAGPAASAPEGFSRIGGPGEAGGAGKPGGAGRPGGGLAPLLDVIVETIPAPAYEEGHPLQALVANLDASPYLGRLGLCRVMAGTLRRGQQVAWCRRDGSVSQAKVVELLMTEALHRVETEEAGPGEIVAVAGIPEVMIGETLADLSDPRPLPLLSVDEPSLSVIVGANTSPLSGGAGGQAAGEAGTKLTGRLIDSRLKAEVIGNVSVRVLDTDQPDTWEVQGRGELALAVLIEIMRREGFELTVGKPKVVTRVIDGVLCEPIERLEVEIPEEHLGAVTQVLFTRRAQLEHIDNHGTGWLRAIFRVPARGLIGVRTEMLTETRGTAQLHHAFDAFEPMHGAIRSRPRGSLVADRSGVAMGYALMGLQERGSLFVSPGDPVYEGMVIGESSRSDDMDVNPTKERKLTNMRSSTAEELVRLTPARKLTLERALELIAEDECVEVTPGAVRVRKVELTKAARARSGRRLAAGA